MSELVDHLARLTGFRDREVLDVTLAGAIRDMLHPISVAIYRKVGEPRDERWVTRARLGDGEVAATSDSAWVSLQDLPVVDALGPRATVFESRSALMVPGAPHLGVFPIEADLDVVGVLEVQTEQPLDLAAQQLVGGILRIYRNFEALLDYSERDTLTGLLNRKSFDETFLKATAQSHNRVPPRSGSRRRAVVASGHWLGLIDIDHFKKVNDSFGHLIGDEVLLLLGRLMRSTFRSHDRLYRFGGEEFMVLMRGGSEVDTAHAFDRLRRNTESYAFPQVGQITISIGFTEVVAGDSPSAAFERADKALYYAKGHGRNQVQSHSRLVASGALVADDKHGDVELF